MIESPIYFPDVLTAICDLRVGSKVFLNSVDYDERGQPECIMLLLTVNIKGNHDLKFALARDTNYYNEISEKTNEVMQIIRTIDHIKRPLPVFKDHWVNNRKIFAVFLEAKITSGYQIN